MTQFRKRKWQVGGTVRSQRPIQQRSEGKQTPLRVLPWWIALIGAAVVGAAIWASTAWLLAEANKASQDTRAQLRIDAIRTGLAVGAGTGGAFALILAVRRQWLHERAQAHQEQVAVLTEFDATQRRITEMYAKGAEQLGSDKAPVRLAGLYALERLAQDNPGHRQTIVNVICAYLRMPYAPPTEDPASNDAEQRRRREERQVRRAAQEILNRHLCDEEYRGQRADGDVPSTYWPDIGLDLSGAHLDEFVLADCRLEFVNCNYTRFAGETVLRGLHCSLAFFQGATFEGHADFRGVTVDHAWFSYATFATEVWFHTDGSYPDTKFGRHASFKNVTFTVGARFYGAAFAGSVEFTGAEYERGAQSVDLDSVRVEDPDAVSPEVTNAPSTWPPGWVVEPRRDGTATLVWKPPTDTD